jgi:hypothetical protein
MDSLNVVIYLRLNCLLNNDICTNSLLFSISGI